ncbi:MAG: hypothetical protein MUO72_19470 [Bacteroidales bacterium]|nr:hypothetical protein [Bacteroidales bacterium]
MEEIYRLDFKDFSRAEYIDLERQMPEDLVESHERELREDEMGVLDPLTASVIVTLGLAGLSILGAWLLKNRKDTIIEVDQVSPNVKRETIRIHISETPSDSEVVSALTKNILELK